MSKLPGLPPPPNVDAATRQWMEAVLEALAVQVGQRGDPLDRAVTVRELGDGGVAEVQSVGKQVVVTAPPGGDLSTDQALPVTPVNFEAHANPRSVVLTWSKHQQLNIAHAEVYRSATNVLEDAVLVGVSPGQSYADTDIAAGQTWFYWLRYMSFAQNPGAWHSLTPVEVTVPELSGDEVADLDVDKLIGNKAAFVEANIGEASITNAMIGNEIRSDNFVSGQRGWRLSKRGSVEIMDIKARGLIEGSTIRGSVFEGGLFISSGVTLTTPTEADRGSGNIRHLTTTFNNVEEVAAAIPALQSQFNVTTPMLDIASADYSDGGVSKQGGENSTGEEFYLPLRRYPKHQIKPKVFVSFEPADYTYAIQVGYPVTITLKGVKSNDSRITLYTVTHTATSVRSVNTKGPGGTPAITREWNETNYAWGLFRVLHEIEWIRQSHGGHYLGNGLDREIEMHVNMGWVDFRGFKGLEVNVVIRMPHLSRFILNEVSLSDSTGIYL